MILIIDVLITCLKMVLTHVTFMIRTKLAKLNVSPIRLHSTFSVFITTSVKNFRSILPILSYLLSGHLYSGSIPNHLMHSNNVEFYLMFPSAMPKGVSVAHIYLPKPPLHHL